MATLVIDASVAASWCFPDERTDYTNAVLRAIAAPVEAIAPQLWAYEVRNSILTGLRRKRITTVGADDFLASLKGLPIRLAEPASYDELFRLAVAHGLTVYDAAYLALAVREKLPLASLDSALIRAAGQSRVAIFQP